MKNPNYLERNWEEYARRVMPPGVSDVQLRETRRGFFAGASSLLDTMMQWLERTESPDEVTEFDLRLMEWLHDEINQHSDDVAAGKR